MIEFSLKKFSVLVAVLNISCFFNYASAQDLKTENVFLITFDGLRWQEVFGGADDSLVRDTRFVKDTANLIKYFWADSKEERRNILMPWFWNQLSKEGQIIGNQWLGNMAQVTNMHWFSYPGYNEILTGFSDPEINTNNKINNRNVTVLEWIHQQEKFKNKVAAFGSWDVFPYIINEERSRIPVNAGFEKAIGPNLTNTEIFLNQLQDQTPVLWSGVRLDYLTHHYAFEYIKKNHPKVVYISYGETDDFAHDGKYDYYLHAAKRTDQFIKDLWEYCQNDPVYKDRTTFLISTDHGRGDDPKKEWTSHGKVLKGSNQIWIAAIGPDTPALGERKDKRRFFQNQIAKTLADFLGLNYTNREEVGDSIDGFILK